MVVIPNTQTVKVINLIFFLRAGLEKLGYEHAFQPFNYSLWPLSRGAPNAPPPQDIHIDSEPPAFTGLSWLIGGLCSAPPPLPEQENTKEIHNLILRVWGKKY